MSDSIRNSCFNIYYLNLSKVYEISMMIDNVVPLTIQKERSLSREFSTTSSASISSSFGANSQRYLADIKSVIGAESSEKSASSSKLIESLDVKTTKSILLKRIVERCKKLQKFDQLKEGDLIKIDNVVLNILNEENLRQILMLRKDALKGFRVEGMEINNLISSILQDYSYVLYGTLENRDEIVIKIPLEIQNEFESKYNINDLLIGHVSVIGVYKGAVTGKFITANTFNYFSSTPATTHPEPEKKVFPSTTNKVVTSTVPPKSETSEKSYQFIDVIAVIQDVNFHQDTAENLPKLPWYKRLWKRLRGGKA